MDNVVDYLVKNIESTGSQCPSALPLTVLEAMVARLFIISTIVGGVPDVLPSYPHNTFLCQTKKMEIYNKFVDAIERNAYLNAKKEDVLSLDALKSKTNINIK